MSTTFLSEKMARYFEDMWIEEQLKSISANRFERLLNKRKFGETNKSFWKIISNSKWDDFNFHFELGWSDNTPLSQVSNKIRVVVHLESQHIKNTDIDKKARTFFAKNEVVFSDHPQRQNTIKEVSGMKLNGTVTPDFSSEEAAKKTIKEIIKILDSPAYKKCAEIADAFINELTNGKE